MGLCLHAGAHRIDRDGLAALPLPAARGPRHVIRPFIEDVELVSNFLDRSGFAIKDEAFGVKTDKDNQPSQFFGALEIRQKALSGEYLPAESFALTVGIRGSYDQTLPRGLAVGSRVFVCDNLAFSGEVSVYAKQTTNIGARIAGLLERAVAEVPAMAALQEKRFEAYRNYSLSKVKGDAILIECVRQGILNPSDIGKAIAEWDNPSHAEHATEGKTVWTVFNAVTQSVKPANTDRPHILPAWERTTKLTEFLDKGIGFATLH